MELLVVVLIAVITIVAGYLYERRRFESFRHVVNEMNFSFQETIPHDIISDEIFLFSRGTRKYIRNMISKSINELDVKIFEYEYTIYKTGTNGRRYPVQASQTVFRFQSQRMNLPGFVLSPESILDKIEDVFGYYQDIDFQQHPAFSRRYLLTGDNEAAIRKLFTPAVLSHFASKRGRSVEGYRDIFIYYRAGKTIKPHHLRAFLDEGLSALTLLQRG